MIATIEEAVYRLLYHRSFRATFAHGDRAALGLPQDVGAALGAVDIAQLEGMAQSILRSVAFGGGAEGDGVIASFPGAFAELVAEGRSEEVVISAFLEAEAFAQYRPLPFAGAGICLPEAFYRWLSAEPGWDVPRRRFLLDHEFLVALMTLLSSSHDPCFAVRAPFVTRTAATWYAVRATDPGIARTVAGLASGTGEEELHVLYAATGSRRIIGPVSALVRGIIALGEHRQAIEQAAWLAASCAVTPERVGLVAGRLREIGLVV